MHLPIVRDPVPGMPLLSSLEDWLTQVNLQAIEHRLRRLKWFSHLLAVEVVAESWTYMADCYPDRSYQGQPKRQGWAA